MRDPLPERGRIAGIDYGTVRVGIAVTDPERRLANPYETYGRRNPQADAEYFRKLVDEEKIVGFVVGLPVHMSGEESQKSHQARDFGKWLAKVTGAPVEFFDERYSTAAADEILQATSLSPKRRKKHRDMLAAQVILTSYLESGRRGEPPGALE